MQADVGKLDIYVFKEGSFGRKGDEMTRVWPELDDSMELGSAV